MSYLTLFQVLLDSVEQQIKQIYSWLPALHVFLFNQNIAEIWQLAG